MSAHVEVVSSDLRRVKVKVSPGTYMIDVLNEATRKLNLPSDKFELKYKQKLVDLSGPYRTSGLGPGAKLELVQKSKSASVISIALDVNGKRYTKRLPNDMTLWQILRQFETAERGLVITGRGVPKGGNSGQLYYEAPVLNIMGREYSALEDLQKTLAQCGISSGSIVIRPVSYRCRAGQAKGEEANESTPAPAKQELPATPPEAESTSTKPVTQELTEPTTDTNRMDVDSQPAAAPENAFLPTTIYSAPTSSTPAAALTHEPDSVYEPTIAHAQSYQQQLQKKAQNTRLKSDEELAADAAAEAERLAKITKVEIKVRFPDQTSAVWTVTPDKTGKFLYQAIRGIMTHPNEPFRLMVPQFPRTITIEENDKKLISTYKLKGREMMNLVWEPGVSAAVKKDPFLKATVASQAKEIVVPTLAMGDDNEEEEADTKAESSTSTANQGASNNEKSSGQSMDPEAVKKKLSKFLGLNKKK
ncbi:uncharacterized protein CTHT_0054180 [Thermochaetoides thermophila DSM 1495]|uniref:TUG ubiquitin-like domain-containing protein n=1 Tax=Chaetomium thermophilum (strain DSM 1495 / CBS 144.50 / IMI 039719) TaxID=759272 RepID=G0SBN2_CHATD|nr:hypothetical protein CTHT_0054180 [Thermochaetoides thermophila DSM 1495]EGS18808.1 hypothetical protein CTHT_0054180 [Thermochaetoides thermophila DSM 1495]